MPDLILLYLKQTRKKKIEIFTSEKYIPNYGKNMKINHKHVLLNTYKIHGIKGELRIIIKDFYYIVGSLSVKL